MDYAKIISAPTPQSQPIPAHAARMVKNAAGGFVYKLDDWDRLDRFLILGTEGGTYYANEKEHTIANLSFLQELVKKDGVAVVAKARAIYEQRRAPKVDACIFTLAYCAVHGDQMTKVAAYSAVSILKTATHLFQWVDQQTQLSGGKGGGSGFRRAVRGWWWLKSERDLAYQVVKYRNRHGFTHLDLMRLVYPTAKKFGPVKDKIFHFIRKPEDALGEGEALEPIRNFLSAQRASTPAEAVACIKSFGAPREFFNPDLLKDPTVWEALADTFGPVAVFRNLGALGARGLLLELGATEKRILDKLAKAAKLVHPVQVLLALGVYAGGKGDKGKLEWSVNRRIVKALEAAWEVALDKAPPIGKNVLVGVDVSGSMNQALAGFPALTCRGAAVALGLWLANKEPNSVFCWFDETCRRVPISGGLDAMMKYPINPVWTDCAQPMLFAMKEGLPIDLFVVITDNETWAGKTHPSEALEAYRKKSGRDAKLITLSMTATEGGITDPTSPHHLNVVGLDANFPAIVREFAKTKEPTSAEAEDS